MGNMQKAGKPKKGYPKNPPPRGPETIRKNTGKGFPFALIPVILAIVLYCNTIPNKYCLDDYCVVVDNTYVHAGIHDIPTILTTNFADQPEKAGGESLEVRVGTAVRSRLAEMCQLLQVTGARV